MIARRRRTNSNSEEEQRLNPAGNRNSDLGRQQLHNSNYSAYAKTDVSSTFSPITDPEMTCRDRTHEFLSAVKSLQSRQGNGIGPARSKRPIHQHSDVTQIAGNIGKDLANTFSKLEKLTILAKSKSLFDDKPEEIHQLTFIIKKDINALNKQIAQLQTLVKAQKHQNGRHKQTHSNSVVVTLQSKLASMSNDFKSVLEVRTQNMKDQKSRREKFSQSGAYAQVPAKPPMSSQGGSVLLQEDMYSSQHGGATAGGGQVAINMDSQDRERYQQQLQLIDEQDNYLHSRAETMQNIEQTIVELGGIFQQLAHMVKEQEEMVQRIDTNVEDTQLNVEGAHSEILKYFQSVTSNRWLMIKIFGVLIFFFIIFVVFMA